MKSIINNDSNLQLIERINKLNPDSEHLWGKMNVSQMFAHCTTGIKIAFGEIIPSSNIFLKIIGKVFKKMIFAQEDFRKNSKTAKEFIIEGERDFTVEKELLINYVKKCKEKGYDIFIKQPHPFFGKLTPEEWDLLMYKHLDHHLKQFGV